MKRSRSIYAGLGIAVFGALVGAVQVQAGEDGGDGLLSGGANWLIRTNQSSGETIKAEPLNGTAQKSQVVEVVKADALASSSASVLGSGNTTIQGDNWLTVLEKLSEQPAEKAADKTTDKTVQNAAPGGSLWASSSRPAPSTSDGTIEMGAGLRPVNPGYASTLDRPYFWNKPLTPLPPMPAASESAWSVGSASGSDFAAQLSATQYNRRRSYRGTTFVTGNGYANVGGYGPVDFPPFQYPYVGYNNNPFTGLSSYSNGYAGGPPSTVPFAGGLHQGRSAFYSQPTMTVPNVNYGVANVGGVGGAYGTGYGGPAIRVNAGTSGGGGGGRGPRANGGSNTNTNVNVNYQQMQVSGGNGWY